MSVFKRWKGERINSAHPKYKEAKWTCEFFADGKTYKKAIPFARNQKEAEQFEREFRASVLGGNVEVFVDKTNFTDFVENVYLPMAKNNNPSYMTKFYECQSLVRFFGDYRLRAITPALIESFKSKRLRERVRCQKCKFGKKHDCEQPRISPSTVNRELTTLSKILEVARVGRKISENPMRFVKKLTEPDPRERFLLPDERDRLMKVLQSEGNEQLLAIVLIAVLTGWRRGQILSLQKTSLDPRTQSVKLIKSKGAKSRFVPVASVVWELLSSLSEMTDQFLFTNPKTGTRLMDFGKTWETACRNAGIKGLRFHDLRRTFGVEMMNLKAGEFTIQTALGHSSIQTTKIYAQVQNDSLRESLERLANSDKIYHSAILQPSGDLPN